MEVALMRKHSLILTGLVILLLAAPLAGQEAAKYSEKSFTVGEKAYLHVKTISGNITVVGWDNPGQMLVQYRVAGENVEPVFEQSGDEVFLKEKHQEHGFFGGDSGSVHFKVFVPAAALLESKTVSGNIRLEKLAGSLEAKTVSGNIEFSLTNGGDVEIASVSGEINGQVGKLFDTSLTVKAISGNIDLQFLGGADARFRASSISGGIDSKLKLEEMESKKGYGSATLSGRIGAGKGKVTVSTISGEITIR